MTRMRRWVLAGLCLAAISLTSVPAFLVAMPNFEEHEFLATLLVALWVCGAVLIIVFLVHRVSAHPTRSGGNDAGSP